MTSRTELSRRGERPRLVFWLGPAFSLTAELRADLRSLPILAVFLDSQDTSFLSALTSEKRLDPSYPTLITGAEGLGAWRMGRQLPVFRLPGRRTRTARSSMLAVLERLAEERPLYIGLGLTEDGTKEVKEVLEEHDPEAPVFFDTWAALRRHLLENRVALFLEEEPHVLVRSDRVPLGEVIADPELRIDDRVRLITTRALYGFESAQSVESLFDRFMQFDERRWASTLFDDVDEWWAIGNGLAFQRSGLQEAYQRVLSLLTAMETGGAPRRAPVCWLPCEGSSGATTFLHLVAHQIAAKGYPTLVVKQLVRQADAFQVGQFLTELQRTAGRLNGGDGRERERPALLVLDTPHAGSESLEELPDRLVGTSRRQVVTLWAARVSAGEGRVPADTDPVQWYRSVFHELSARRPERGDAFLSPLEAGISAEELERLEAHVESLRTERGLALEPRTRQTWTAFQEGSGFRVAGWLPGMTDQERRKIEGWLRAEELFWPSLYHFIRKRGEDPYAHPLQKVVADALRPSEGDLKAQLRLALLLQVAKASNWGVIVPSAALVDWADSVRRSKVNGQSPSAPEGSSDARAISEEDVQRRLQAWARSGGAGGGTGWSALIFVRKAVDGLCDEGQLRSILVGGHPWVRCAHQAVARALLRAAHDLRGEGQLPPSVGEILGELHWLTDRGSAFRAFRDLLPALSFSPQNLVLCEQLSEALLLGSDQDPGWHSGEGEDRLEMYETILPQSLVESSRALLHHRALVRRRTTFNGALPSEVRRERLEAAKRDLDRALDLPWQTGVRDEHPGHLLTSLGLVNIALSKLDPSRQRELRREAQDRFQAALTELPDSRHTRQGLADLLVQDAEVLAAGDPAQQARAVALCAEALQLLSVEPSPEYADRWYRAKEAAIGLFDKDEGRAFVRALQEQGVEAGFLLEAEAAFARDRDPNAAVRVLYPLVRAEGAGRYLRSARRVAQLMSEDSLGSRDFAERFRLLSTVEGAGIPLTPDEEFQLAYLEYHLGRYQPGNRRFAVLWSTGRYRSIRAVTYLRGEGGDVALILDGKVDDVRGEEGEMTLHDRGTGRSLFRARFRSRHFADRPLKRGERFPVAVRFTGSGPKAVPERFAREDGYRT